MFFFLMFSFHLTLSYDKSHFQTCLLHVLSKIFMVIYYFGQKETLLVSQKTIAFVIKKNPFNQVKIKIDDSMYSDTTLRIYVDFYQSFYYDEKKIS